MIWVIGSTGMLGSEIAKVLAPNTILSNSNIDITDLQKLKKFSNGKKIDWIINCAAYTNVDKAEDDKYKASMINQMGASNVAVVASLKKAKLIHFSTDYVFSGNHIFGYCERDFCSPKTIYGKTKYLGEQSVISKCNKYFIFRLSWLYGQHGDNFVDTMLGLFTREQNINVISNQYGSPTNAKEVACFIKKIIDENSNRYGLYHFSGVGVTNWYKFAKKIYEYSKMKKQINIEEIDSKEYPQKAKRPFCSYLLKNKLYATFDYTPMKWEKPLKEYLNEKIK